ncbi:MAG: type III pantothenate kinase [Chromatiales bacterium]|nr:type III pantothenate kinase [Chromatiales bacterium]
MNGALWLVDCGNTRVRVAAADVAAGTLGAIDTHAHGRDPEGLVAWLDMRGGVPDRMVASCVGAEALWVAIRAWAETCGVRLDRFVSPVSACGVTNAYARPGDLGADRFAAMIGAFGAGLAPCLIIDAGSAVTIDLLAADGIHHGGAILPGRSAMVAAIGNSTTLHADPAATPGADFADSTPGAIAVGRAFAYCGTLALALERAEALLGLRPRVVCTGGDAAQFTVCPGESVVIEPALVLRGLLRYAAACP